MNSYKFVKYSYDYNLYYDIFYVIYFIMKNDFYIYIYIEINIYKNKVFIIKY